MCVNPLAKSVGDAATDRDDGAGFPRVLVYFEREVEMRVRVFCVERPQEKFLVSSCYVAVPFDEMFDGAADHCDFVVSMVRR